eukprot:3938706-Rhodomonas_salina.3
MMESPPKMEAWSAEMGGQPPEREQTCTAFLALPRAIRHFSTALRRHFSTPYAISVPHPSAHSKHVAPYARSVPHIA